MTTTTTTIRTDTNWESFERYGGGQERREKKGSIGELSQILQDTLIKAGKQIVGWERVKKGEGATGRWSSNTKC